jgi:hypothetical protein
MYGNKKLLTMVACILIFALAFVPTHRVGAVVPAIPAAVYYAIAATGVAGGIYAANRDSLDYVVSDYWNKTSDYVKKQWSYTTAAGWMGGKMIVDGALSQTVIDYLRDKYHTGVNRVKDSIDKPSNFVGWTDCIREDIYLTFDNGSIVTLCIHHRWSGAPTGQPIRELSRVFITGYVAATDGYNRACYAECDFATDAEDSVTIEIINSETFRLIGLVWNTEKTALLEVYRDLHFSGAGELKYVMEEWTLTGDPGGFGAALAPDREVKVPCPPVPDVEWPDRWIDDLERELNDVTADQYVENMDQDFDWYIDKDGSIYKRKKGEPPKKEDDTKLVPPIPPPYQPVHPEPGQPGPATPDQPWVPADPCPYCPSEPGPAPDCPNPYCPNHPSPQAPPVPDPNTPADPCPYCPPSPDPGNNPCPNPYCPSNPDPQTPPAPKPQPGEPGGPPPKDDRYIDLEPLKKLPHIFTRKFPFSLPWDFYNSFKQLEGNVWDGKIDVNIQSALADFVFTIDLSMFDNIRHVVMKIELLIFDIALILVTRRLMGGGV